MLVYKFCDAKWGLDNLEKARIKASTLEDLNDPFEFNTIALNHEIMRSLWRILRADVYGPTGVFCFSKSWRNPVIWSHYADNHRGIALGFEVPNHMIQEIRYRKTPLRFSSRTLSNPETPEAKKEIEVKIRRSSHVKFKHWEYENEARSIANKSELIEDKGLFFKQFGDELKLKEVVIGARSQLSAKQILSAVNSEPKIVTSRLAFQTFSVVPQRKQALQK
ncbi:DUF2971 domain-containing protein [Pseudophaeobacter leonis]|uniref:DUF2971 domain-containing protein n=1 Tax=Pseudophaeobacter leonis TaxID=1144477 RepID=UPI0009F44861|nr:DUF2971 domain-containing protein [Pseudophaeobacter leonis]